MSRALNDLSAEMKPLAIELLARCCEQGIPVMIVDTLRTPQEHAINLAKGVSWTIRSKHLTGDAIDICLYDEYKANGPDMLLWNADHPDWMKVVAIGESLGLVAGARWKQRDMGHFELPSTVRANVVTQA